MPTDQDRAEAIANPRAGDVWEHRLSVHTVEVVKPHYKEIDGKQYMVIYSSRSETADATPVELFQLWTKAATLLRRGA
jgi:hypothetical protein